MKVNSWNSPFLGLAYFLGSPCLWGWALLGTIAAMAMAGFAISKTLSLTFPHDPYSVEALRSLGWALLVLVLMIAVVFPLIFNACFAKAFSRILKEEGDVAYEVGFWESSISSFWVFFRTMKWRILWPLILIVTILFLPPLIFPISLLAANHLAVIESADLALTLFSVSGDGRVDWIRKKGTRCFAAALSGSLLTFLLSLVIVGWLFWFPAIYCGVFLWVRSDLKK
ncbi:MAG: hypothetical protein A3E80_00125 [Chlamydiae bacterium RIFCSPHIGHO2_12_FULL_49_9]|nr:MAG: hypothetical protein A3E80_00125 [Chlamydiae bacterium RIFCSPHIGHO2_12_FULL_49_9]